MNFRFTRCKYCLGVHWPDHENYCSYPGCESRQVPGALEDISDELHGALESTRLIAGGEETRVLADVLQARWVAERAQVLTGVDYEQTSAQKVCPAGRAATGRQG